MTLSTVVLAIGGTTLLFAGDEVVDAIIPGSPSLVAVLAQLLGGAWLGVAALNWFTRGHAIGGIYGRPLLYCNLTLYLVSSTTLLKAATGSPTDPLLVAGFVAGAMTVLYAWLAFRSPV
jgi:hypothetical protein